MPRVVVRVVVTTVFTLSLSGIAVLLLPPIALAAGLSDATQLDPVQITASHQESGIQANAIGENQALIPGTVTLVDGNKLQQMPVNNLDDALRYVPGVVAESETGGKESFLSVRGSNLGALGYDNSGIKLFQDGLPVTTADGNNHNRLLDADNVRYLDVANGANALTYGASTLGGAINTVSRTALNSDPGELFIGGGSYGQETGRVSLGGVSGNFDGMLSLERSLWGGYREHGKEAASKVNANLGWQLTDSLDLRFYASHIDSKQQLAGALTRAQVDADPDQANPDALRGDYQKNVRSSRLATRGNWQIDENSYLEFGLSYEKQSLYHPIVAPVMVDFDGPGPQPPVEVFSLLVDTDQATTSGMTRYHLKQGNHNWLVGMTLSYTTDRGGNYRDKDGYRNGETDQVNTSASDSEFFALDRWQFIPAWTLIYGGQGVLTNRHDQNITDVNTPTPVPRNRKDRYDAFNPRAGLIHDLIPHNQVYVSISRLYEAPNNFDLDNVRTNGNGGAGDPQATLAAMHGISYETGLRGQLGEAQGALGKPRWHWAISLYHARLKNEILSVEVPGKPGTFMSGNVDNTIHEGIELQVGASLAVDGGWLEPLVSGSWNHFAFDDDSTYGNHDLPGAPHYQIHGEVIYRTAKGLFAGPTFQFVGDRFVDFANNYRVGGYGLLGLRAGYHRPGWDVYIGAGNLLDRDYIASASTQANASLADAVLYPGQPRSVYAGFHVNY
jgi:iron complex outermembrane receptor protein